MQPGWADELAAITLSGPGGSVTLDGDTDRPVTILRNLRTGQIRGVLRDGATASLPRNNAAALPRVLGAEEFGLQLDPDVEALTSRGLPDPGDWL